VKGCKTIFQANGPKKQAGVATLISNKIDSQPKVIKKRQGGALQTHQRLNLPRYALNSEYLCYNYKGSHILKETLVKLKAPTAPHTIIVGDFNNQWTDCGNRN
jgi:hypothetical protein